MLGMGPGSCASGNLRGDPLITPTRALTPKAQLNQKPLARSPRGRVPRREVRRPLNVQPKCSLKSLLKYWGFFSEKKRQTHYRNTGKYRKMEGTGDHQEPHFREDQG